MSRDFHSMLKEGNEYEDVILSYLQSHNIAYINTQTNPLYQQIGIDLIITLVGDMGLKTIYGEVKADNRIHKTGNIFVEESMQRKTGFYKGWFYTCKSHIIFYIDTVNNIIYSIDWSKLKEYIHSNNKQVREFYNKYDDCYGYGYLINIDEGLDKWIRKEIKLS